MSSASKVTFSFWPDWYIEDPKADKIGQGGFGTVYKIRRDDLGFQTVSAVKIIHVPQNEYEIMDLRDRSMDDQSIAAFYRQAVEEIADEIKLLLTLKDYPNIVTIEDYHIEPNKEGIGYTVYIRMPLLKSLEEYARGRVLSASEVVKIGSDICDALTACEGLNINHRDIKPANIFINKRGDYLLGDFGIARQMDTATQSMHSQIGTANYMAPEISRGGAGYDRTVDYYSLGLMLYRYLNHNRFPFERPYTEPVNKVDLANARIKRESGEEVPMPDGVPTEALGKAIQKACAFDPKKRYRTAAEMKDALQKGLEGVYVNYDTQSQKGVPASSTTEPARDGVGNLNDDSQSGDSGTVAVFNIIDWEREQKRLEEERRKEEERRRLEEERKKEEERKRLEEEERKRERQLKAKQEAIGKFKKILLTALFAGTVWLIGHQLGKALGNDMSDPSSSASNESSEETYDTSSALAEDASESSSISVADTSNTSNASAEDTEEKELWIEVAEDIFAHAEAFLNGDGRFLTTESLEELGERMKDQGFQFRDDQWNYYDDVMIMEDEDSSGNKTKTIQCRKDDTPCTFRVSDCLLEVSHQQYIHRIIQCVISYDPVTMPAFSADTEALINGLWNTSSLGQFTDILSKYSYNEEDLTESYKSTFQWNGHYYYISYEATPNSFLYCHDRIIDLYWFISASGNYIYSRIAEFDVDASLWDK